MAFPTVLLALCLLLSPWASGPTLSSGQQFFEEVRSQALVDAAPEGITTLGQGGAWMDVDGDGLIDFVLPGDPSRGVHLQWIRNLDGQMVETAPLDPMVEALPDASKLGPRTQVLAADFDNDGTTDLYLSGCELQPAASNITSTSDVVPGACATGVFFENLGGGRFRAHEANGLKPTLYEIGSSAGDVDGDGLLDLYVSEGHMVSPIPSPPQFESKLYINKGNFNFEDSGLFVDNKWGCVTAIVDFDYDGDQDIVSAACNRIDPGDEPDSPAVATATPVRLFKNTLKETGQLGFEDATLQLFGKLYDGLWMNVAMADINDDGRVDFFFGNFGRTPFDPTGGSTDLFPHLLMVSQPGGTWADESVQRGVADHEFNWGGAFVDINNDGHVDLVTVGSIGLTAGKVSNNGTVYLNDGEGRFSRVDDLGVGDFFTGGLAVADMDKDGSQDIMVVGQKWTLLPPAVRELVEPLFPDSGRMALFKGTAPGERHVALVLEGVESNKAGIGAFGTVCHMSESNGASTPGTRCQQRVMTAAASFASTHSPVLHYGVPDNVDSVDVTVVWPSGREDVHSDVAVGGGYRLQEGGDMSSI